MLEDNNFNNHINIQVNPFNQKIFFLIFQCLKYQNKNIFDE